MEAQQKNLRVLWKLIFIWFSCLVTHSCRQLSNLWLCNVSVQQLHTGCAVVSHVDWHVCLFVGLFVCVWMCLFSSHEFLQASLQTPTRTMCFIYKLISPATVETPRKFEKLNPNIVGLTWHAWNVSQICGFISRIHLAKSPYNSHVNSSRTTPHFATCTFQTLSPFSTVWLVNVCFDLQIVKNQPSYSTHLLY